MTKETRDTFLKVLELFQDHIMRTVPQDTFPRIFADSNIGNLRYELEEMEFEEEEK